MSFVVWAALAVGLLVAVPIAAHLLRRGRTKEYEFPPAALVPSRQVAARQRSRLEDRLLLGLRAAIVLALAALGATPLVKCSRLSLDRKSGASVAMVLVLDDSLSMRGTRSGDTRFERAKTGAKELLRSAREGDAVAIVLSGKPARLALAATTDLAAARAVLDELQVSDRASEVAPAVAMARSTLKPLPHTDKRVAVFSDFAEPAAGKLDDIWAPLPSLTEAIEDCGVASAEVRGRRVTATVACTTASAARGRALELSVSDKRPEKVLTGDAGLGANAEGVLTSAKLAVRSGPQTLALELPAPLTSVDAQLTGADDLKEDDLAPVAPEASALLVGVVTDPDRGTVSTGGPTALEQALSALSSDSVMRPLSLVPDDDKQLAAYRALVLDDPPGLGPETRSALRAWLERGGVALAFLGPRAAATQLGSTLEPFADGAVHWETTTQTQIDVSGAAWLGGEADGPIDLADKWRVRFEANDRSEARVLARWHDGEPFLLERNLGHGLVLSAGLPTSVQYSDLALRSLFLALLDQTLAEAARRAGPRRTEAGVPWLFPAGSKVEIAGPNGPLHEAEASGARAGPEHGGQKSFMPVLRGRYQLTLEGEAQERIVTLDPAEIAARPRPPPSLGPNRTQAGAAAQIDASPELALLLLGLVFVELLYRVVARGRWLRSRRDSARTVEASS